MPAAVLIHGGFHGGWCWDKVHPRLQEDGWTVYTPSLTGAGDRVHLASPRITLRTHVQDVLSLIEAENLTDVVLCGHSAAGMVITGVADAIPERLHTLVYLDAFIPNDGESAFDIIGQDSPMTIAVKREAAERGQGWFAPSECFSAADFGVTDPVDAAWVEQNLTGHPISAFADPLLSTRGVSRVANKIYVRCTEAGNRPHYDRALTFASSSPEWTVYRWPSVHDVMITEPDRVLGLFASIAASHPRRPTQ
jgi:pimeloyl-ACP methyl ester carboxylesterase